MIKISVKNDIKPARMKKAARKGSLKALTRAAAYVRAVAKRKIRTRKKKASKPGQPPFDHRMFKQSIRFSVSEKDLTAHIGPQRISKPENLDGPVPHTLEFGGIAADSPNRAWFVKKAPKMTSISQVADYFQAVKFGPLFMANSPAEVVNQARKGHNAGDWQNRIRKRKNEISGKTVFFLSVPIRSRRMAIRAAKNVVQEFGFPTTSRAVIAPRPFMGPSLEESKSTIAQFWKNTI